MADTQLAGQKRPSPSSSTTTAVASHTNKKRKIHRRLQHTQHQPAHTEHAPQDPIAIQGPLLRSIAAALAMVGFDSVKPSALEMLRGVVEEYMLRFLHRVQTSMRTARRTVPTALDFASALAHTSNTSSGPSQLTPQLHLQIPSSISAPSIPSPTTPPPEPAANFSTLLAPLLTNTHTNEPHRTYIPKHFPPLPAQHAWKRTPVFAAREHDARKMRERATEEGILAEQALRKLAQAAKRGLVKAEKRREGSVLSGEGRKRDSGRGTRRRDGGDGVRGGEDVYGAMVQEVGGTRPGTGTGTGVQGRNREGSMDIDMDMDVGLRLDGVRELREEQGVDLGMPEGVLVNWDMGGWRRGGSASSGRGRKGVRL